jgi:proliferating cell nuclear antigen PCNA
MGKLIEIITEHVIPFKTFIEGLKDILNEIIFEIIRDDDTNKKPVNNTKKNKKKTKEISDSVTESESEDDPEDETEKNLNGKSNEKTIENKNKRKGGIKIAATDSTRTLLINVKLEAAQFSKFECKKSVTDLGINLQNFHKLIKTLDKDDILCMYVEDDDRQNLVLKVSNPEKKYETIFKLKLMEINKTQFNIPPTVFDATISFETGEFHRICREMSLIAEHVEIKCTKKTITYTCKGDSSERNTMFYADENGVKIRFGEKSPEIVQGIFELKNLVLFSKYSNLCTDIQIFMKNNYPLCIKYSIATLGHLFFCLTPIKEDDIMENFSDEDEDYDDEEIKYIK